ncbi:hypothetical protein [Streptomyces azureus]|uniref:TetR family transcriptional regulator n=1 Tax=Streptomyces azureus TaxID=146537 RepID=A0A0K8PZX8_STRAJ|nr:hypothetical protein [Streptomyces azureus]GAP53361.1 TetR family transcriptional regulator [Streptomyces azureus]
MPVSAAGTPVAAVPSGTKHRPVPTLATADGPRTVSRKPPSTATAAAANQANPAAPSSPPATPADAAELPRLAALSEQWEEITGGHGVAAQLAAVVDGLLAHR